MILSFFMLRIKIRAILNSKLKGLHENVQNFYSMCLGSREIAKNEVETVLVDTLYVGDGEHQVGQDHQHVHHAGEG